jgi:hypothetical protein
MLQTNLVDENETHAQYTFFAIFTGIEIIRGFIKKKLRGLVRQRTISTERPPLVGEASANFSGWGCRVVSATNPHGR